MNTRTQGLTGLQYWLLIAGSSLTLLLVLLNILMSLGNRDIQEQVVTRQQGINQGVQLSRLNTQVIRALATLSARTNDAQLKELLQTHGVTFTVNPAGGNRGQAQ